tara:strand:+ start:7073 stop:7960 length:888 start_codon:yes stop_codon:yes gene_type:complete
MIKFKIIKKIEECEILWKKISPNKTLWDIWEVNYSFYNPELYRLHFIAGYEGDELVGLLPLWLDIKQDVHGFFGGEFPEKRTFFVKDKKLIHEFFEQLPEYIHLMYIDVSQDELLQDYELEKCDTRYFFSLDKFGFDFENILMTFNKKHRKNFRYDLKQLQKLNYKLEFGRKEDFNKLVEFNKKRFGSESDFEDKDFLIGMQKFIDYLDKENMLHVISVVINDQIEGVEIGANYNGVYYVLNAGSNRDIKNLGKLLIVEHIKNAMKLKVPVIDFLSGDSGWKKLWNCEEEILYEL